MQSIIVDEKEAGQRLDKFLKRYFRNAEPSLLYKMLRKKNIVLNKSKANGNEIINAGDEINSFFSDETFEKFTGCTSGESKANIDLGLYQKAYSALEGISIVYEDENFAFMSKPVGVVSQTDENNKYSINEWLIGYLLSNNENIDFNSFKPSCSNRIDRNTSGLIMGAKSYAGSRFLSDCIKGHKLEKYYLAICHGRLDKGDVLKGYLKKDHNTNKVKITNSGKDTDFIHTEYDVIAANDNYSLLLVKLITGKSHQIRAHLSSIGHPLVGDVKYSGKIIRVNNVEYNYQLLHAYKIVFPVSIVEDDNINEKSDNKISPVANVLLGKEIKCPPPSIYLDLWDVDIKI